MVPLLRQRMTVSKNDRTIRLAVTAKMKKQAILDEYKNTDHIMCILRMNSLSRRFANHNQLLLRMMKRMNTITELMLIIIEKI